MKDTCNRLCVTSKPVTLRKWANIIAMGESLPGCVDLDGEKASDGRCRLSHHGGREEVDGEAKGPRGVARARFDVSPRRSPLVSRPVMALFLLLLCSGEEEGKKRETDAFELHGSYRNGWSSSTLALGRQRPAGPS